MWLTPHPMHITPLVQSPTRCTSCNTSCTEARTSRTGSSASSTPSPPRDTPSPAASFASSSVTQAHHYLNHHIVSSVRTQLTLSIPCRVSGGVLRAFGDLFDVRPSVRDCSHAVVGQHHPPRPHPHVLPQRVVSFSPPHPSLFVLLLLLRSLSPADIPASVRNKSKSKHRVDGNVWQPEPTRGQRPGYFFGLAPSLLFSYRHQHPTLNKHLHQI